MEGKARYAPFHNVRRAGAYHPCRCPGSMHPACAHARPRAPTPIPLPRPQCDTLPMSRTDIIRFYAATPVWFWPVLAWNLYWLRRYLDARAASETFLVRIHLGARGRLRLEWLARPERAAHWPLSHSGPPRHALFDLDRLSKLSDGASFATRPCSPVRCAATRWPPSWVRPALRPCPSLSRTSRACFSTITYFAGLSP